MTTTEHESAAAALRRDLSSRTVRITNSGIFFGEDEFPYAVMQDSIKVENVAGRYNLLTLTIPVSQVVVDPRKRRHLNISGPYIPEDVDYPNNNNTERLS